MTPMTPGPAGSVPQVSNERRPGLKYNTSNDGIMRVSAREGSELDKFLDDYGDDHDLPLGLAFTDYLQDNHENFTELTRDQLHEAREEYPKHAAAYESRVRDEVMWRLGQLKEIEASESATVDEPEEAFTLKSNQELIKDETGKEYILETPHKKGMKIESKKKYSIIDPLAEPFVDQLQLDIDPKDESEPESESS